MLDLEVMNEVKTLGYKSKEMMKQKCFTTRDTKLRMILQSLKLYEALKMMLGIS